MKMLFLDIETSPKVAHVWGLWQQNVSLKQLIQDTYVLNWGAAWLGSDEIMSDSLHFHKLWDKDPTNDKIILESIWKLLDEADVVVGHNGDRFDLTTLNSRFLIHGMPPPSKYQTVDTLKIAKRKFRLTSNKLEFLARSLGLGGKMDTGGFDLWSDIVLRQDIEAFDKMVKYCEQDVILLEEVYMKLRAWDDKHIPMNIDGDLTRPTCNVCGSTTVHKRGYYHTKTQTYQKYCCASCGHNMRSGTAESKTKQQKQNILRSN